MPDRQGAVVGRTDVSLAQARAGGAIDDGKLWHGLQGFSIGAPHARSRPRLEHELIDYLKRKFASLKIVFGETAVALQADFGREGMLEVSHSEAAATDLDHLLVLLTQSFIVGREDLMNRLCKEAFRWPIADKRLPDFSPASVSLKATAEPMAESSGWTTTLLTLLAAGLLAYLAYLVLLANGVVRP